MASVHCRLRRNATARSTCGWYRWSGTHWVSDETMLDFYRRMVQPTFDQDNLIMRLKVRSFSAQSAHDTFWDFVSLHTEATHHVLWNMSDRGLPRSFRTMEGFNPPPMELAETGPTE